MISIKVECDPWKSFILSSPFFLCPLEPVLNPTPNGPVEFTFISLCILKSVCFCLSLLVCRVHRCLCFFLWPVRGLCPALWLQFCCSAFWTFACLLACSLLDLFACVRTDNPVLTLSCLCKPHVFVLNWAGAACGAIWVQSLNPDVSGTNLDF